MSRAHPQPPLILVVLFLTFALLGSAIAGFDEREDAKPAFAKLNLGMAPEQVRQLIGDPKYKARQILYHRYREQWTYDAPHPIRLTFDCPRGEVPQLLSIKGVSDQAEPRP